MKKLLQYLMLSFLFINAAGCVVRQQDLNAWVGQPVEELDTHSLFLTLPMIKTKTDNGIEIRDYVNKKAIANCAASGFGNAQSNGAYGQILSTANFSAFQNCSAQMTGCDNIFYIKNKKVIEYKPVGRCYTNESVQPEHRNFN